MCVKPKLNRSNFATPTVSLAEWKREKKMIVRRKSFLLVFVNFSIFLAGIQMAFCANTERKTCVEISMADDGESIAYFLKYIALRLSLKISTPFNIST
jgi:hypothetical protein